MPNAVRFYIDKAKGAEHSRVIDVGPWVPNNEQPDIEAARQKAEKKLKSGEQINSAVSINVPDHIIDSHPVI